MKLLDETELIEKYKDGSPFYCCYHIKSRDFISTPRYQKLKFDSGERWLAEHVETGEILSMFNIVTQEDKYSRYACFNTEAEMNKYYLFYKSKYLHDAIEFESKQLDQLKDQLLELNEKYDNKDCQD